MRAPCERCGKNPPIVPRRAPVLCLKCWRILVPEPVGEYGAGRAKHAVVTTWYMGLRIRASVEGARHG